LLIFYDPRCNSKISVSLVFGSSASERYTSLYGRRYRGPFGDRVPRDGCATGMTRKLKPSGVHFIRGYVLTGTEDLLRTGLLEFDRKHTGDETLYSIVAILD
jgi:hypothetical protein